MEKILKNLIFTLIIALVLLFHAIVLSFTISRFLPGDPVLAYLPEGTINWDVYEAMKEQLGLNQPIIIQFFIHSFNMLLGDWGRSFSIARSMPVTDLIMLKLPYTLVLLSIPLIIGLLLGFCLANYSIKTKSRMANRLIQLLSLIGFACPIFLIGIVFQLTLGDTFPSNTYVLWIVPWIVLTIPIMTFTIVLVRTYLINQLNQSDDIEKRSIVPFTFQVGLSFGIIYAFLMITEIFFDLNGINNLLLQALFQADYWTIVGMLFFISISFVIILTTSLLLFILYGIIKNQYFSTRTNINQIDNEVKLA